MTITYYSVLHRRGHSHGNDRIVYVFPPERLEQLLTSAKTGDTLHHVPAELCTADDGIHKYTAGPLLDEVDRQLASGEGTQL